jgi:transposase
VWIADEQIQALRRQVARRAHIVRRRTRLKDQLQAILQRNLVPRPPVADQFGIKGRYRWPATRRRPTRSSRSRR